MQHPCNDFESVNILTAFIFILVWYQHSHIPHHTHQMCTHIHTQTCNCTHTNMQLHTHTHTNMQLRPYISAYIFTTNNDLMCSSKNSNSKSTVANATKYNEWYKYFQKIKQVLTWLFLHNCTVQSTISTGFKYKMVNLITNTNKTY